MTSPQASLSLASQIFHSGDPMLHYFYHPIYGSSKIALHALMLHLARELRVSSLIRCGPHTTLSNIMQHDRAIVGLSLRPSSACEVVGLRLVYAAGGYGPIWVGQMSRCRRTKGLPECQSLQGHRTSYIDLGSRLEVIDNWGAERVTGRYSNFDGSEIPW